MTEFLALVAQARAVDACAVVITATVLFTTHTRPAEIALTHVFRGTATRAEHAVVVTGARTANLTVPFITNKRHNAEHSVRPNA